MTIDAKGLTKVSDKYYLPVCEKDDPDTVATGDTGALITVAILGVAAIACTIALIHFGGVAFSQWQVTQEDTARQELADLKACLSK